MPKTSSMREVLASRRRAAMRVVTAGKLDAMLVTHPPDVGYLSGFSGEDSYLVIGGGWSSLITDGRFAEQAAKECDGVEIVVREKSLTDSAGKALGGRRVRKLGYQKAHISVAVQEDLSRDVGRRKLVGVSGLMAPLRAVKGAEELTQIRKAVRIAQKAFGELIAGGAKPLVGRTERQIAAQLEYHMRSLGADAAAFETIVAAGPNGSRCHHQPGQRRVRKGEALLIDWGARVNGYHSDLTRVVFLGTIPPKLAEIYDVVRRAQEAGIAACRPGVRCKTPDAAARDVIESAGYGKEFVHGLGHGLGRQIHEAPWLAKKRRARLRAGMVVTVEPGIYLPGVGGVRIEDDILITLRGHRQLTAVPKSLEQAVLH